MSEKTIDGQDGVKVLESGVPLLPIPLLGDEARTERVSSYVEPSLLRFYERYRLRMGARSVSEVIRRLTIIGAQSEGHSFEGEQ